MNPCDFGKNLKEDLRREIDEMKENHNRDVGKLEKSLNNLYDRSYRILIGIASSLALQLLTLILWAIFKK